MKLSTYFKALLPLILASQIVNADQANTIVPSRSILSAQQLTALLASPTRPNEDSQRDKARKPAQILGFSGVASGDTVLDLFSGDGWYTELFSMAVGPDGKVYAQNDEVIWRFAEQGIKQRTKDNRLPNVVRLDNIAIDKITIPDDSVDIAFMALNYHDLFFTEMTQNGKLIQLRQEYVDHKSVLALLKLKLKPDGIVIIIDHAASTGSGYEAANQLHRIDPEIVKAHFTEAGFTLREEAYYLRNKNDTHQNSVFDPSIRGNTDRFIFKFGK
ncbi:hypothetical protein [Aliiglaciecola sp. LCG003]|uniref:class I SAM-dependent methyltransferase n=1 Tax=Aliiglaciecola sp. LCG003 TaxID=3053655 RepID=UPI0025737F7A|nr:hypothetical protein [Aliiglaciecola sp. LCG003]WJG09837.1 hypothetical protein QR722_02030 [Aliiglaciecola sp. LCG003]